MIVIVIKHNIINIVGVEYSKVVIVERVEEPMFDDHDVTIVDSATSLL